MNNLPYLYSVGADDQRLAAALRASGNKTELIFPEDDSLLEQFAKVQRRNSGSYYQCRFCSAQLVARRNPASGYGFATKARSAIENPCSRCSGIHTSKLIAFDSSPSSGLFDKLVNSRQAANRARLRLKKAVRFIAHLSKTSRSTGNEARGLGTSTISLAGLLLNLTEGANLSVNFPERDYVKNFQEITPYLEAHIRAIGSSYELDRGRDRLVFPSATKDFDEIVSAAIDVPSLNGDLQGTAFVIGRIFRVDEDKETGDRYLTFTHMRAARLFVPHSLWLELCKSFGEPKMPVEGHTVESLAIAQVVRDGGRLRVREAAWIRTNRYGILSLSDYEHETAEALIKSGYKFIKSQSQYLRFGTEAMLVDFLVFLETGTVVLEEDPSGSVDEPRKKLRDLRFKKAGVSYLSHDGARYSDLRYCFPPGLGPWWPGASCAGALIA